jgi:hypothetical protein
MTRKPAAPRKPRAPKAKPPICTVRMYCHGLGDCFLIRLIEGTKKFHIMIDGGILMGTPGKTERMTEVFDSIHADTGGQIDLLVLTHEHYDHVSGFAIAQPAFDRLTIKTVWYAWTEDPDDKLGVKLQELKNKAAFVVDNVLNRLDSSSRVKGAVDQLMDAFGAKGSSGTREGMIHPAELAEQVEYRKPGETLPRFGAKFHILGPPRTAQIFRSDPSSKDSEVYEEPLHAFGLRNLMGAMQAVEGMVQDEAADQGRPFDHRYNLSIDRLKEFYPDYEDDWCKYRRIDREWEDLVGQLALALESDTNNTSLAFALELSDQRVLIFAADAQVGNWLSWHDQKYGPGPEKETMEALFRRTVFYKVGHHGSHNATLREKGLEMMTSKELHAMIPVEVATARKKGWNEMPLPVLVARLRERTNGRVAQADDPATFTGPFRASPVVSPLTGRPLYVEVDF